MTRRRGEGKSRRGKVGEALVRAIMKDLGGRTRGVAGVDVGTEARALVVLWHRCQRKPRGGTGAEEICKWCGFREHRIRCPAWG